jgi:hypothetical protein
MSDQSDPTSQTVTDQYMLKKPIVPQLVLATLQLMRRPHTSSTLITSDELNGCQNPNYIHRLLAQCKQHLLQTPFLLDFATGGNINIETCEIGYLVNDRRTKNNVLNR